MNPSPRADSPGRLFVSGLLALAGIAGLLASLCGGGFTLNFLFTTSMRELLVISVPSLLLGGVDRMGVFSGAVAAARQGGRADQEW